MPAPALFCLLLHHWPQWVALGGLLKFPSIPVTASVCNSLWQPVSNKNYSSQAPKNGDTPNNKLILTLDQLGAACMTAVDSGARWQTNLILLYDDGKSFRIQMELDCQFDSLNAGYLAPIFQQWHSYLQCSERFLQQYECILCDGLRM